MCEFKAIPTEIAGGKIDINCVCEISGKEITISNKHGMFCEDLCQLQENKDAGAALDKMFDIDEDLSDDEQASALLNNLMQAMQDFGKDGKL